MQIRKRWLALGILLCLWIGPAGVASLIALLQLTGTDGRLSTNDPELPS